MRCCANEKPVVTSFPYRLQVPQQKGSFNSILTYSNFCRRAYSLKRIKHWSTTNHAPTHPRIHAKKQRRHLGLEPVSSLQLLECVEYCSVRLVQVCAASALQNISCKEAALTKGCMQLCVPNARKSGRKAKERLLGIRLYIHHAINKHKDSHWQFNNSSE